MNYPQAFQDLVDCFKRLPGIGGKSAERLAYHVLSMDKKYVDEFYRTLAMGIYNLQYAYDPSMIIIGGAISTRADLLDCVNEQLDIIFSQLTHAHVRPNIKVCKFGNDANLIGATYHYKQVHEGDQNE